MSEKINTNENIEKKIDVKVFVKKYNQFNSNELKNNYVKSIINDRYVDYLIKIKYAQDIVSISSLDKNGNIKLNSPKRYSLYMFTLINLYTYIDVKEEEWNECLDLLEKDELIDVLLQAIPGIELKRFETILKMCQDDLMVNNYEIHGYASRNIENLEKISLTTIEPIISVLSDKINELTKDDLIDIVKIFTK